MRIIKLSFSSALLLLISVHSVQVSASNSSKNNSANCDFENGNEQRMEQIRDKTHSALCSAVETIDSWFGNDKEFDSKKFGGKLIIGFRQDEDDGFDPKLRVRINAKLPNLSKRAKAFLGRTDDDAFITDAKVTGIDDLSNDLKDEDASWLIGLDYTNPNKNGFSTSIGARISSGFQPYAKIRYRYFYQPKDGHLIRFAQTGFWRDDEGIGTTSNIQYNYLINEERLLTWNVGATYKKDTEIWETGTNLTLYNKLSNKRGIAYKVYILGESGDESVVDIPEYGVSVAYSQPFLRPWLILKTSLENRWVHDNDDEPRKSLAKLGMQLEMKFGNYKK